MSHQRIPRGPAGGRSVLFLPFRPALTLGLPVTPASRSHPNLAARTRPWVTRMRRVGAESHRNTRQPPINAHLSSATVATRLPPRVVCRPHPVTSSMSPARTALQPDPRCAGPRPSFPVWILPTCFLLRVPLRRRHHPSLSRPTWASTERRLRPPCPGPSSLQPLLPQLPLVALPRRPHSVTGEQRRLARWW